MLNIYWFVELCLVSNALKLIMWIKAVLGNVLMGWVLILLNEQVVSGIAMPSGSDKLYTGSTDETVRVWDCQSGQVATIFCFAVCFICYFVLVLNT